MGVCDGERKSACARRIDLSMIYLKIAIDISTLHATRYEAMVRVATANLNNVC